MNHYSSIESLPRNELEALQLMRLKSQVDLVSSRVSHYQRAFEEIKIGSKDLNAISDVSSLPFTVKDDMRKAYPYHLFAADMKDIVRIHSSSGTTGQITVVGYTKNDIEVWSECVARAMTAYGLADDDIIHVAYGYGLFTGGLGVHYGSERLGSATIPVSGGNTSRQIQILRDFDVTAIAATPSYALLIAETMKDQEVDPSVLPLRIGIFGAEPWSQSMRKELEETLQIKAYDIYGLSEIMGPGVGFECPEQKGLHINEDHFLVEIIDPKTLIPVAEGEYGEVVITTLTKEGIPLIRYRTRDISRIIPDECQCGRTFKRIDRLSGRSDDMLIIRGVNVYPSQIEDILVKINGLAPHYQIHLTKKGSMDTVLLKVELNPDFAFDEVSQIQDISRKVRAEINSTLGISVEVRIVPEKTLLRSEGKINRVIDERI